MAASKAIIVCIVLAQAFCEELEAPPSWSQAVGNGPAAKGCRYEFTVPDKVGMCSSGNAALDNKVDQLKSDLDKTRLQYVSQHTTVQDQLSKVQNNVNNYGSQVNDLYSQLRQLESQISNLPNGKNGNDINNLIEKTKDSFHQALHNMENKVFNVSLHLQQDAIEQSKVNAAIEMQVRIQDEKARKLEEKLKDVLTMISGSTGSSTLPSHQGQTNPAMLKQVSDRLANFDKQIQMYDQLAQQQFSSLVSKTNDLSLKVNNQSHHLNNIGFEANVSLSRVLSAEKKIQKLTLDVNDFQNNDVPKIQSLEADMTSIKSDTRDIKSQLSKVATKAMTADVHSLEGASGINDLKVRIELLTNSVSSIMNQLANQSTDITHLADDLTTISNNINPSQLQKMKDALKALQNTGVLSTVTQAQLKQVETEIHSLNSIVNGLQHAPHPQQHPATSSTTKSPPVTPQPTQPSTMPPFHVPHPTDSSTVKPPPMQTTAKPFKVPTLKVPDLKTTPKPVKVPAFKVPTFKVPSLKTNPIMVPTLKAPTAETTKTPFKIPTPPPKSPDLGPVIIKSPTLPPAFKIPVLPGNNKK